MISEQASRESARQKKSLIRVITLQKTHECEKERNEIGLDRNKKKDVAKMGDKKRQIIRPDLFLGDKMGKIGELPWPCSH